MCSLAVSCTDAFLPRTCSFIFGICCRALSFRRKRHVFSKETITERGSIAMFQNDRVKAKEGHPLRVHDEGGAGHKKEDPRKDLVLIMERRGATRTRNGLHQLKREKGKGVQSTGSIRAYVNHIRARHAASITKTAKVFSIPQSSSHPQAPPSSSTWTPTAPLCLCC